MDILTGLFVCRLCQGFVDIKAELKYHLKTVSKKVVIKGALKYFDMKIKKMFSTESKFFTFIITPVICLIMMSSQVEGQTNYYFSSSKGDDARSGSQAQNPATPWRTITKLNSFFESISPGDSILFKRGDTFYGSLVVNKSGTSGKSIVISAYGSGPKPVISGFSTISSWTSPGNNIYEATVPNNKETVNCVVIDGVLQPIGRYPKVSAANGGFLNFESHSGDGQITDNQLTGDPDWTGGEIVIRKNHWVIDRTHITSHTGNVINFTPVTTFYKLVDRSGYFIQNHPSTLSQNGDWCYDYSTNKIKIFYSTAPPEVKVSTLGDLLTVSTKKYIKISDISFEGANARAVYASNVESMSIDNCNINYSGTNAVQLNQMGGDIQFNNNTISNSLNNAVSVSSKLNDSYCTIRNNVITNTGMIAGMSGSGDGNCNALGINAVSGAIVEYNTIKNTGYIPINFNGNNILIKNNIIDNYSFVKDDAAGIYTYNGGLPVKIYTNRIIKGNIISNGIGNPYGTYDSPQYSVQAYGIYMDNNVNHVDIIDNTVFNISSEGNHNNSSSGITMTGNTFFNIGRGYDLVRWANDGTRYQGGQDITNMNFQNNIFFTTSAEQNACYYRDQNVKFPESSSPQERIAAVGTIDNNYYHLPNELGFGYLQNSPITFANWKLFTGFEKHGKIIPAIPSYHLDKLVSGNLYPDGQFSRNISGVKSIPPSDNYILSWDDSRKVTGKGSLKISFKSSSSSSRDYVQLYAPIGPVSSAKNYILRFSTSGTTERGIVRVCFRNSDTPRKNLTPTQSKPFGTSRVDHEFLIKAPDSDENASWEIAVSQVSGTTCIDNVEVYEANVTDININDRVRLEVNATKEVKTVSLGPAGYTGVDGTPYSGSITLKPFSSKILILNQP